MRAGCRTPAFQGCILSHLRGGGGETRTASRAGNVRKREAAGHARQHAEGKRLVQQAAGAKPRGAGRSRALPVEADALWGTPLLRLLPDWARPARESGACAIRIALAAHGPPGPLLRAGGPRTDSDSDDSGRRCWGIASDGRAWVGRLSRGRRERWRGR